jgi:hypothetical protein
MALRVGHWKTTFMEQRGKGFKVWKEPLVAKRVPDLYNLRTDPFERASEDADMFYATPARGPAAQLARSVGCECARGRAPESA